MEYINGSKGEQIHSGQWLWTFDEEVETRNKSTTADNVFAAKTFNEYVVRVRSVKGGSEGLSYKVYSIE